MTDIEATTNGPQPAARRAVARTRAELQARVDALQSMLEQAESRAEATAATHEAFRQKVRDRMVKEANDRGWCTEFDDILVEFGLEPRGHYWEVQLSVSVTLNRNGVWATNWDHATDQAVNNLPFCEGSDLSLAGVPVNVNYVEVVDATVVERQDR